MPRPKLKLKDIPVGSYFLDKHEHLYMKGKRRQGDDAFYCYPMSSGMVFFEEEKILVGGTVVLPVTFNGLRDEDSD